MNTFIEKKFDNSRLLTERESVYEAKHVIVYSVKQRKDDDMTLVALGLPTSAINSSDPYQLEVLIKEREVASAPVHAKQRMTESQRGE